MERDHDRTLTGPDSRCGTFPRGGDRRTSRTVGCWRSQSAAAGDAIAAVAFLCDGLCETLHIATNLAIDPRPLEQALKVGGERTKTAVVTRALEEYVARRGQKRLLDLFGALEWNHEFDYKGERSRR